jgi:putative tricarboxylic transport membrane protein
MASSRRIDAIGRVLLWGVWLLLPLAGPASAQHAWRPQGNVELVVPASPGGSLDRMTRIIQKIWIDNKLINATTTVVNKPGGGHIVGAIYVNQGPSIGRSRLLFDGYSLVAKYVRDKRALDFTPIALLFHEFPVVSVPSSSPIRNGRDLIEALKKEPRSLSIGVAPAVGAANYVAIVSALEAAGVDVTKLKIAVFPSAPESAIAVLGHHVDVISSPESVVASGLQTGQLRIIAAASPTRLTGSLSNVPTWKEQGVNSVVSNWRAVFAPKRMATREVDYWNALFAKTLKSPAWQRQANKSSWVTDFRDVAETKKFVESEYVKLGKLFKIMGIM